MRITFNPVGALPVVIADDALGAYGKRVLDEWPDHSQLVQSVPRVRAVRMLHYSRANTSVTYNIMLRAGFATISECRIYRMDLMNALKGKGNLVVNYDGAAARTLVGAVCTSITFPARYGISTDVAITFVGETMT